MGSSCNYGEPNLVSTDTSSNSRKGRKSSTTSDKPKQPRRGLGVAQLEKIRLHNQMGYTSTYLPPPNPLSHNLTQEYMIIQTPYSSSSSFVDSPPSSSSYGFSGNPSVDQMGLSYLERENVGYADVQPDITARWPHGNVFQDTQQFTQPIITRQLFEQEVEESIEKRRQLKVRNNSRGSTSHNSESNGNQDLDLELRLSL